MIADVKNLNIFYFNTDGDVYIDFMTEELER